MKDAPKGHRNQGAVRAVSWSGRMLVATLATLLLVGRGALPAGDLKDAKHPAKQYFLASAPPTPALPHNGGGSDSSTAPKFFLTWGKKGDKPGEFYSPIEIAINRKDEVYITDLNNARVQSSRLRANT